MQPLIVGVAGGSGSGKSTVVQRLFATLGEGRVALLETDAYYRDRPDLSAEERAALNYDHPDATDEALLAEHLRQLKAGQGIHAPRYDFVRHARMAETQWIPASPCVVVEGILVLATDTIRDQLDLRLYVETDADVRFIRRLRRDIEKRGRTAESVMAQWEDTVRPMHLQFVEPSKRHADLIIPEGGHNMVALDVILAHLKAVIDGS